MILFLLVPILLFSLHAYLAARVALFFYDSLNKYPEYAIGFGGKIQCGTITNVQGGDELPLIVSRYMIHIYPTANKNGSVYIFYFQKSQPYLSNDDYKGAAYKLSFPITWYFPPKYSIN